MYQLLLRNLDIQTRYFYFNYVILKIFCLIIQINIKIEKSTKLYLLYFSRMIFDYYELSKNTSFKFSFFKRTSTRKVVNKLFQQECERWSSNCDVTQPLQRIASLVARRTLAMVDEPENEIPRREANSIHLRVCAWKIE